MVSLWWVGRVGERERESAEVSGCSCGGPEHPELTAPYITPVLGDLMSYRASTGIYSHRHVNKNKTNLKIVS